MSALDDETHREFLLAALRVASARAKLMDSEIVAIGVALKGRLIGPETAVEWIADENLMFLVEPFPTAALPTKETGNDKKI
jgi:hypothetical protein